MSQLQLLGIEKMKYERDGGECRVIGEWVFTPSFATWLYNQINVYFETTGEQNYHSMHDYKISRFSTITTIILN